MGDESFFTAREEAELNILADNSPPLEAELHQEIPCKFSCCKELNENMNTEAEPLPKEDLVPTTMMIIRMIQKIPSGRLLRVLFDSGGTKTMIHSSALPRNYTPRLLLKPMKTNTIQGVMETKRFVSLDTLILPEFDRSLKVEQHWAYVFDGPCKYDLILGRDFLGPAGIILDFLNSTMKWCNLTVPMKHPNTSNAAMYGEHFERYFWDDMDSFASHILESKYEEVDPVQLAHSSAEALDQGPTR